MSRIDLAAASSTAQVWPPILAIDPGSQSTGVCLRVGTTALEAVTLERAENHGDHREPTTYALEVVKVCREIIRRNREALNAEALARRVDPTSLRHAVETLVAPKGVPAKGRRSAVAPRVLASLPTTATVLGVVIGTWPRTLLVAPRGGSLGGWDAVEGAPSCLRGRTPTGWLLGGEDRSHQRSAWGIAGAAHFQAASSLREQAASAARHAAADWPGAAPDVLIPILRRSIIATDSWDLFSRLPALARAVVAMVTRDRDAAAEASRAVAAYLIESEDDGRGRA